MSDLQLHYCDEHCVVVEKPAGILAVPGLTGGPDLASQVLDDFPDARIVHRLDQATSGLMLFARGAAMASAFGSLFKTRAIDKRYEAIVWGAVAEAEGTLDAPLVRDWPNRPRQKVCYATGKASLTHYTRLAYLPERHATRVSLTPLTGRTHQLRVHLWHVGHPILGDALYGHAEALNAAPRLCLHAAELRFQHPILATPLCILSPVPF
jgi:tRNA pseudouridine32 synthase / 23S rRNA pseudouridine746 synthase